MEFSKAFFEEEEKNGFRIASMMKKAWAAQLEVLEKIDFICKKYDITYFADWGTLLGTIRHQGFIPWDDDIDITMLREDYMKFLAVAPKELPKGYRFLNISLEPEYTQMMIRVTNASKVDISEEHMRMFHGCPYVVGIDIFPLDYIPRNEEEDKMQLQLYDMVLSSAPMMDEKIEDPVRNQERENLIRQIQDICRIQFDRSKPLRQQFYLLGERIGMMYGADESDCVTQMLSRIVEIPNYRLAKEWYDDVIYMPFENFSMPVPKGYHEILKVQYGENYMTPVNCRGGHDYPFYKDQEQMVLKKFGFIPE